MLLASPHMGWRSLLRLVTCFHLPTGPAQTSGGSENDCPMTAERRPWAGTVFAASEALATSTSPPIVMACGPFHSVVTAALLPADLRLTVARPSRPSICSAKRISSGLIHSSQVGVAWIRGGTSRGTSPPAAETG